MGEATRTTTKTPDREDHPPAVGSKPEEERSRDEDSSSSAVPPADAVRSGRRLRETTRDGRRE